MTDNTNLVFNVTESLYVTVVNVTDEEDVESLAETYMMYKIGAAINTFYFPIMIPVGIVGNVLSFLVMIQPHNRHMSISLYIAVLAVADTVALVRGLTTYLNMEHNVDMYPDQFWYCNIGVYLLFTSTLCSALFVLSMTFDRFYSIIRPHKAASFNTVKRAKKTIICIVIFSIFYNVPHWFVTRVQDRQCVPYGLGMKYVYGQLYYWVSFNLHFALPFVLLLAMNSVIIHTLRSRLLVKGDEVLGQGQGQSQGQSDKMKSSEVQITVTLLVVTFSFLVLTTPAYILFLYGIFVDYRKTPYLLAGYYLFYNVGQKSYFTNYGINFFLYVISGKKFKTDLMKLFKCNTGRSSLSYESSTRSTGT